MERNSLSSRIFQTNFITSLLAISVVSLISYGASSSMILRNVRNNGETISRQIGNDLAEKILSLEEKLNIMLTNPAFSDFINADLSDLDSSQRFTFQLRLQSYLKDILFLEDEILAVRITGEDGRSYSRAKDGVLTEQELEVLEGRADRRRIEEAFGKFYWERIDGRYIAASKKLFDIRTTEAVGRASFFLDRSALVELIQSSLGEGQFFQILDADGRILAGSPFLADSGSSYFLFSRNIPVHAMTLSYFVDKQTLRLNRLRAIYALVVAVLFAAVLSFSMSKIQSRRLTKDLDFLMLKITRLKKHRIKDDEVRVLTDEFDRMSSRIEALIDDVSNERVKREKAERHTLEAELDALHSRMDPHFLYNALGTIDALARLSNEKRISFAVDKLSFLMMENSKHKEMTTVLEEEIKYSEAYLELQRMIGGNRLAFRFETDDCLNDAEVPRHLLQPVVENAILHGIRPQGGRGEIVIRSACRGKSLLLTVEDDGIGMGDDQLESLLDRGTPRTGSSKRVGLSGIHRQIRLLYGDSYGIQVRSRIDKGTCVEILLPLILPPEEADHA